MNGPDAIEPTLSGEAKKAAVSAFFAEMKQRGYGYSEPQWHALMAGLRAAAPILAAGERARVDNAIDWQTSCLNCATLLDSCYAETVRREQAEEKLAAVRALAEALGDRSTEPRERTLPSDRRLMEPLRRMLLEILDGAR